MKFIIMRYIIYLIISVVLGFIFPKFHIETSFLNTLYSVIGIMFSVGISQILSINTQNIKNVNAKRSIQGKLKKIMKKYIIHFIIVTIIYIATACKEQLQTLNFVLFEKEYIFNYSLSVAAVEIICIMYYVVNMKYMRDECYKIEDIIDKEQSE